MSLMEAPIRPPRSASDFKWTGGSVNWLRELWGSGLSCRQIGNEMGVTRNSIIGKVHRLGLSKRKRSPQVQARVAGRRPDGFRRKPLPKATEAPVPQPYVEPPPLTPPATACSLLDLQPSQCRWPYGDAGHFLFCGATNDARGSYCAGHTMVARGPFANTYQRRP
jgi:GcrA cell cycle regulator